MSSYTKIKDFKWWVLITFCGAALLLGAHRVHDPYSFILGGFSLGLPMGAWFKWCQMEIDS